MRRPRALRQLSERREMLNLGDSRRSAQKLVYLASNAPAARQA